MPTSTSPAGTWIGQPLRRVEDERFLLGKGCFTDDIEAHGAAHACFVRSPHPHAIIESLDLRGAKAAPGVLTVLSGADLEGEVLGPIPSMNGTAPFDVRNRDGRTLPDGSQPVLASGKVRYVGEPVAVVIAATAHQAREAAERVVVDYRGLEPVMTYADAVRNDAARIWDDLPHNRTLDWSNGHEAQADAAFDSAARIVCVCLENNRVAPCFMEPRSAVASFDAGSGRYLLQAGCQSAHGLQAGIAGLLGLDPVAIRVVAPDTGGGFGARGSIYPEYVPLLIGARRLNRAVRWTADRTESFLSDAQSRDHRLEGELALDAEGNFLALKVRVYWRHGAYLGGRNAWVIVNFLPPTVGGVYRIPLAAISIRGAFTNTTTQAAFRGIGRVESNYLLERLIDTAARECGRDPIGLRRQNLIRDHDFPFTSAGGATYTSGAFASNLARAAESASMSDFARRRAEAEARGKLRGLGLAMFIENDGGAPSEFAEVTAGANGRIGVYAGTQDFGMGHATIYKQVAAERLGLHIDDVDVIYGDTDRVRTGSGSHGSRSARIGGTAVVMGTDKLIERARVLAAEHLEAAGDDIRYASGRFTIVGTDRSVSVFELARSEEEAGRTLSADAQFVTQVEAHSNGCVVCEVEVDPETGLIKIERHTMVMDVGRALNPMIVEGQLHGGAAQGLGQAGFEGVQYDVGNGQTLTGSFMDYNLPKADDFPMFATALNEISEADNPLGVKGAGESATSGSPAAFVNAVANALAPLGVSDLQMPLTPFTVWQAIRSAGNDR